LIVKNGAFRNRSEGQTNEVEYMPESKTSDDHLFMNGPEIFNFTIGIINQLVDRTLAVNGLTLGDIDRFVFHQANKYMLEYLRKKLNIPAERFHIDLKETGNTVSATIPIALESCLSTGSILPGNRILVAGFGVGYSWAGTVLTFI